MLEQYLAEGAYRFQMHFGRCEFASFFGRRDAGGELLAERHRWLGECPGECLQFLPQAAPLISETLELALQHGIQAPPPGLDDRGRALHLGKNLEPDYLLLCADGPRTELAGGCVCFPSSWALKGKIGLPIEAIHEVVPGLNAALGRQIQIFLDRLRPGTLWTRSNWGLSRSPERNQHPNRGIRRLDEAMPSGEVFFRVEEQALTRLPRSNGILFGIRIVVFPLRDFFGNRAGEKLRFALETMPEEVARYKGLGRARERIIDLLRAEA